MLILTCWLNSELLAVNDFAIHSIDSISCIVIVIIFLNGPLVTKNCTYNEGILALDRNVTDFAVFAEGLVEVFGACASAETAHVDLGVP